LKDYEAPAEAWDAKRSGIKEKIRKLAMESQDTAELEIALRELENQKPKAPRTPRLLYVDATPEALSFGLAKQWPSGGVFFAEGGIVFGSHGMSRDSFMRNLSLLNQL
jgi:putative DNA primase/helicase